MITYHYLLPLLTLAIVDTVSILSPGPNVILVVQAAADRDRRSAFAIGAGLVAASALWATFALSGLAALFEILPRLQSLLRIAGAVYLLWLALRLWRGSNTNASLPTSTNTGLWPSFRTGLLVGLLNPKVLAYFGSVFVLLLPGGAPLWVNVAAVFIVIIDGILVYGGLTLLMSTSGVRRRYASMRRGINRTFSVLLTLLGGRLLMQLWRSEAI